MGFIQLMTIWPFNAQCFIITLLLSQYDLNNVERDVKQKYHHYIKCKRYFLKKKEKKKNILKAPYSSKIDILLSKKGLGIGRPR